MNRKSWKQTYKRFSKNKLKRKKSKLNEGKSMERHPKEIKARRETI